MKRPQILPVLAALVAASAVIAGCGSSSSNSRASGSTLAKGAPITIGAVIDQSSTMKPFDGPALAAAEIEAKKINAAGGVDGHKIVFRVENDKLQPSLTRADALNMVSKGVDILWVTCDVDFATPSTEVGIAAGKLTISPCTSTDQVGPKRFGSAGKLAFTFGSIAQDEGAALAQFAIQRGWKTADVVTDKVLAYTIDDAQAFTKRFTQLGGKIVAQDTFTQGDNTIGSVANHILSQKAQVIDLSTIWSPAGDLPAFVSDVRSAGDMTPILGPWSIDGTFWLSHNPSISTNIFHTAYSSIYGDDPDPAVRALEQQLTAEGQAPATGGYVLGATAVQGIAKAIQEAGGSVNGDKLASIMQTWHNVSLIGGPVTFPSPQVHGVVGRPWRMIEVKNGKARFIGMIKATSPAGL
jgi:branched-chain amino acid transport system substrate-binding protein